jgi:hypothetical protein
MTAWRIRTVLDAAVGGQGDGRLAALARGVIDDGAVAPGPPTSDPGERSVHDVVHVDKRFEKYELVGGDRSPRTSTARPTFTYSSSS